MNLGNDTDFEWTAPERSSPGWSKASSGASTSAAEFELVYNHVISPLGDREERMNRVLLPFPLQRALAGAMAMPLGARVGRLDWRRFPDGESLVAFARSSAHARLAPDPRP
jgi:hypothetical protein